MGEGPLLPSSSRRVLQHPGLEVTQFLASWVGPWKMVPFLFGLCVVGKVSDCSIQRDFSCHYTRGRVQVKEMLASLLVGVCR